MNWLGEFTCQPGTVFRCGAKVVIATERGTELGQQVSLFCNGCNRSISREQVRQYIEHSGQEFYKLSSGRILREATPRDIAEHQRLNAHILEDIDRCALLAAQLQLDMKVITAEHLLGGERIIFYFRAEQRVDFRELVRELARLYHTRVELRQVGARDEARLVADYEICGRECCCKNFLKKLRPVSMKMAKLQKSTLDPAKLSGRCGRLRCCLRYEHEGYEALERKLPRIGSRVATDFGAATVVDRQILTQLVLVRTDEQRELALPVEEIRAFDLPKPPPAQVSQPPPQPPQEGTRPSRPAFPLTRRRRHRQGRHPGPPGPSAPPEA
jgi:cell fate regulator YaaT (PSP1 superfamily)